MKRLLVGLTTGVFSLAFAAGVGLFSEPDHPKIVSEPDHPKIVSEPDHPKIV
ncbi:hypothetical protein ACTSEZ_02805 [Metabacillus sp. JX24]|uniref:hypothetical protein n=1 Tax=Metabacillus sp. JX24 TaxID=3240759 RepID=UPI003510BB4A